MSFSEEKRLLWGLFKKYSEGVVGSHTDRRLSEDGFQEVMAQYTPLYHHTRDRTYVNGMWKAIMLQGDGGMTCAWPLLWKVIKAILMQPVSEKSPSPTPPPLRLSLDVAQLQGMLHTSGGGGGEGNSVPIHHPLMSPPRNSTVPTDTVPNIPPVALRWTDDQNLVLAGGSFTHTFEPDDNSLPPHTDNNSSLERWRKRPAPPPPPTSPWMVTTNDVPVETKSEIPRAYIKSYSSPPPPEPPPQMNDSLDLTGSPTVVHPQQQAVSASGGHQVVAFPQLGLVHGERFSSGSPGDKSDVTVQHPPSRYSMSPIYECSEPHRYCASPPRDLRQVTQLTNSTPTHQQHLPEPIQRQLQQEPSQHDGDERSYLRAELSEARQEIDDLRGRLQQQHHHQDQEVALLRNSLREAEERNQELLASGKVRMVDAIPARLPRLSAMLRSAVTSDRSDGYVARTVYDELYEQLQHSHESNQLLKSRERELQSRIQSVQAEAEFRDTALSNCEQQKNISEGRATALEREIEVLKAALKGRDIELAAAYKSISDCEKECDELRSQLYSFARRN